MKTAYDILAEARAADRRGDYSAAAALSAEASKTTGGEFLGRHFLAWTHLTYGRADLALGVFQEAIDLDPLHIQARLGLAHSLYETNHCRHQEAYRLALPHGSERPAHVPESVMWTRRPWSDTYVSCENNDFYIPIAYLAYSVASGLNDIANVDFDVGLLDLPYLYLRDISLSPKVRRSDFSRRWLNHLVAFMPLTNHYCTTLGSATLSHLPDLNAPENAPFNYIIGPPGAHTLIHERICHVFDFITDLLCFEDFTTYARLIPTFTVATRACSEGFAYWMQHNGVAFHNMRCPSRALPTDTAVAEIDALSDFHPYKVGIKCFQTLESRYGESNALLAYFIAMDTRDSIGRDCSNADAKAYFRKPWNNPNCRLRLLADVDLSVQRVGNVLDFGERAQRALEKRFESLTHCSLDGGFV